MQDNNNIRRIIKNINSILIIIGLYLVIITFNNHNNRDSFTKKTIDASTSTIENNGESNDDITIIISDFNTENIEHARIIKNNKTNELYIQYNDKLVPLKDYNVEE